MRHALCALRSAWSMVSSMRFALCALRDQRGVFIVEVLVAGVVFAIAVIGLVLMFGWGQTFVVAQGNDRVALYLAQQQIESLRASGYAAAEALNSNCGGNPGLDETLTAGRGNSQSFTRQTDVEYVNNRVRHVDAEQVLVHPARRARRGDRPDADQDLETLGNTRIRQSRQVAPHHLQIEAELSLHEIRTRLDFRKQSRGLPLWRRIVRRIGAADEKARRGIDGAPGWYHASVAHLPNQAHDAS